MKSHITKTLLAVGSALIISASGANAQAGTAILEDFEGYSSDLGAWVVVDVANIVSVDIALNLTDPLEGLKCLNQLLGVALPGANFTVQNLNLNMAVPADAEEFTFTMRSLIALNLGRTVTITLIDQDSVAHVSDPVSLATLIVSTEPTDISVDLSAFTPPIIPGDTTITGVKLNYNTSLAGVAGAEDLDSLRFEWQDAPAAATGWMLYE